MAAVDIANDLVNLCRQGQFKAAIDKHYGDNIVSVECIEGTPEMPSRLEGIESLATDLLTHPDWTPPTQAEQTTSESASEGERSN